MDDAQREKSEPADPDGLFDSQDMPAVDGEMTDGGGEGPEKAIGRIPPGQSSDGGRTRPPAPASGGEEA